MNMVVFSRYSDLNKNTIRFTRDPTDFKNLRNGNFDLTKLYLVLNLIKEQLRAFVNSLIGHQPTINPVRAGRPVGEMKIVRLTIEDHLFYVYYIGLNLRCKLDLRI